MTLSLAPGAMTRRLNRARLGVIRSYTLADGHALRVFAVGTDAARAIAAHLIGLGYDAVATGDRVTVTRPEPVAEPVEPAEEPTAQTADELIAEVLASNPSVARRVARAEERARHGEAATRRAVDAEVEVLLDEVEARADAEYVADEEQRVVDLLAATPAEADRIRASRACKRAGVVEADVPPTGEERVTVRIRASELRPGDEVVDALGERQYAAFDVQHAGSAAPHVKVWTAIRDQERGLPPVVMMRAERELLVLRPLSEEGRELLATLDGI